MSPISDFVEPYFLLRTTPSMEVARSKLLDAIKLEYPIAGLKPTLAARVKTYSFVRFPTNMVDVLFGIPRAHLREHSSL